MVGYYYYAFLGEIDDSWTFSYVTEYFRQREINGSRIFMFLNILEKDRRQLDVIVTEHLEREIDGSRIFMSRNMLKRGIESSGISMLRNMLERDRW